MLELVASLGCERETTSSDSFPTVKYCHYNWGGGGARKYVTI